MPRVKQVRLHGIDAPELDQTFWWCGTMSLAALETLIARVKVRCEVVERDRHGRLVAKVFSPNGVDIGRRLVAAGWALAYRRYSKDYVDAENQARRAKRGMWRGTFVKPWVWRASSQPRPTQEPDLVKSGPVGSRYRKVSNSALIAIGLPIGGRCPHRSSALSR
jgi:endonuclease YncB( thermonuclease family)